MRRTLGLICAALALAGCASTPQLAATHRDAPPPGASVHDRRTTTELRADTAASGALPCYGDGRDGSRVQALYVVASDKPDRYSSIAPLITQWAGIVDQAVNTSAQQTGGTRHVRWVMDGCALNVAHLVIPASADDDVNATFDAMKNAGYNQTGRKYLAWVDANVYCGMGNLYADSRPGLDNPNATQPAYARIDNGCWGYQISAEFHELGHMLGAVQADAPNRSAAYHCTDDSDRMCYDDGAGIRQVCPTANEAYWDCGHNDYFYAGTPPAGSYLATHWNVANSPFLEGAGDGGAPSGTPSPTATPVPSPTSTPTSVSTSPAPKTCGKSNRPGCR